MGIILIGAALILIAAYGLSVGYDSGDWTISGISWAGIVIGALMTLFGFGKRASEKARTNDYSAEDQAQVEIRALVQAMGTVATADHKIRDQEVAAIAQIHEKMLGLSISNDEIREILNEFDENFDITNRLTRDRSKISPTMKRTIVQSCHLVMVSDFEIVKPEENRIEQIGLALGFDPSEISDLIAAAET